MSQQITTANPEQSPETMYLLAKAEIDIQIATAHAFPRDLRKFQQNAIAMATISEEVAESCIYAMPRKKRNDETGQMENSIIEGPSVRLAEIIAATYGNIRVQARVIENNGKTITAQGVAHDLESNNAQSTEVKARITYKNGAPFNDDLQVMIGNAACSKARRNATFACVPKALIDPIYNRIKEVAKGTVAELEKKRNRVIDYLKGHGASDEQIFTALGVKSVSEIDQDKLVVLIGFGSAIKNEGKTVKDLFEQKAEAAPSEATEEAKTTANDKADKLKAKRIAKIEEQLKTATGDQKSALEAELEELKA